MVGKKSFQNPKILF